VLSTGLSDRVRLIHLMYEDCDSWKPSLLDSPHAAVGNLTIGILVNPDEVDRAIDRGPSADDKEAATAFRRFWGEKAELRRFKDGSIIESLVWTEKGQTHSILQQLVLYIVQRHVSPEVAAGVQFIADKFSQLLPPDRHRGATSTSSHRPFLDAFEQLAKRIRELEGLPLSIRHISASCPALRYTSILSSNYSSGGLSQPMDITVQFEGSNRWPEDLGSVQRTKIAFLLKMGDLLEEASPDLTTRLGLENEDQKLLNGSFLDIINSNKTTFRLRIHHELELTLLNRILKDKSLDPHSREEAASVIAYYKRTFIQSPSHTQALRTLRTRFPFLSPSIRLLKQWCFSHLLSGHITEELIELLTIRTFVTPYPWTTPGSLRTAFLRTLTFISKWDWHSEPLIVDFSGAMTAAEIDVITTRFEAWRKIDPALNRTVLFAASNLDPEGITWTERGPSKVVAARLTTLARAACAVVKEKSTSFDTRTLFTPSLADYDWVIHVNPKFTRGGITEKKEVAVFKNLQTANNLDTSLTGYDPVRLFLEELESIHGKNIVLFYNANSMAVIAGLWNPQAGLRSWKVNLTYSTIPIVPDEQGIDDEEGQVTINKTAILNDIARLGGGLISRIETKRVDI
jgi:U3 small nucleolar RNA-associated protein 22